MEMNFEGVLVQDLEGVLVKGFDGYLAEKGFQGHPVVKSFERVPARGFEGVLDKVFGSSYHPAPLSLKY